MRATFWLHMCKQVSLRVVLHVGIVVSRRNLVTRYHFACIAICVPHLDPCRGYGPKPGKGYKWPEMAIWGQNRHLRGGSVPLMHYVAEGIAILSAPVHEI